jgi:hypothetical protein
MVFFNLYGQIIDNIPKADNGCFLLLYTQFIIRIPRIIWRRITCAFESVVQWSNKLNLRA